MLAEVAASTDSEIKRKSMVEPQAAKTLDLQTLAQCGADATAAGTIATAAR